MMGVQRVVRFFTPYDEWKYWNRRADPNVAKGWDEERLAYDAGYIREHVAGCRNILEFGPGVGRTFEAYTPEARITCLDVTENYRVRLLERAQTLNLKVTHRLAAAGETRLPFDPDEFDATVASQVLQHQRPDRVAEVMGELIRVARRVVAIASWGRDGLRSRRSHVYHHDYVTLCGQLGCQMDHVRLNDGTVYFIYRRLPGVADTRDVG